MANNTLRNIAGISAAALLAACSTTTNFKTVEPDTTVAVKTTLAKNAPRTETMKATSFGNYEFVAQGAEGDPMYGVLPLKFNGGYLAADILFFAPAMFFNLREPYPFYEFDVAKNTLRYRKNESDPWVDYVPTADEASRSKRYFELQK